MNVKPEFMCCLTSPKESLTSKLFTIHALLYKLVKRKIMKYDFKNITYLGELKVIRKIKNYFFYMLCGFKISYKYSVYTTHVIIAITMRCNSFF